MNRAKGNSKAAKNPDLVIAGGGLAGLALAAILGRAGVRVDIIDPGSAPAPLAGLKASGRTVALMESSLHILRAAGIGAVIEDYGCPLENMRIVDDSRAGDDPITRDFEAHDIGLPRFGMNLPNNILRSALFETISAAKAVRFHGGRVVEHFEAEEQNILVKLDNGETLSARLLAGADGRRSAVRALAGIEIRKHEYGQSAITCVINHSRSHNNTATEFHRPGGPLAFVPMKGNQSSIVWVETTEQAEALIALPRDAFEQTLQTKSANILGGITLETSPECWPLMSLRANALQAPRTVILAEAAHVMSPITAQGLNLSLRDVAALAETVVDALRLGLDPGSSAAVRGFERRRVPDVLSRVTWVDLLNRVVSNDSEPVKDLRRAGLKAVSRIAPLRHAAMRYGLAPSIDQGRLARGLPL